MILTLTHQQMLAQWMLRRHLLPMRGDIEVVTQYGYDMEQLCTLHMRDWYLNLLATASPDLLAVEDIAPEVTMTVDADGVGTVALPADVVRVLGVESDEWLHPATVVTDPQSPLAMMQRGYYSRGGAFAPGAIVEAQRLRLYTFDDSLPDNRLSRLLCVRVPADGTYRLDERALSLIPPPDNTIL